VAGHRYYLAEDIENLINTRHLKKLAPLANAALSWATVPPNQVVSSPEQYCATRDVFTARLERMSNQLASVPELHPLVSLITAVAGEIGNNSFDHNIGNWPDLPGVYFGYDVSRRYLVLADRGVGVLHTLQHVRPALATAQDALRVAFTERVSGRDPEARGNGLKFVRKVITENPLRLTFRSGDAQLQLRQNDVELNIKSAPPLRGCLAILQF